jgi:hypothetical protein
MAIIHYRCEKCSNQFPETELVMDINNFLRDACPKCRSDELIELICDDCQEPTDWKHAVQEDPWGRHTGEIYCENCAEKRWDRFQEYLMEIT